VKEETGFQKFKPMGDVDKIIEKPWISELWMIKKCNLYNIKCNIYLTNWKI
jgi:hypothetical protein